MPRQAVTTTLFTLPTQSYPTGVHQVPVRAVPLGATLYKVGIDISQMGDPATSFDLAFDVSYDGGANWQFWVGGHRDGGPALLDKNGVPQNIVGLDGPLQQPDNPDRQLRGSVTVDGPITVGGTVTVT